MNFLNFPESLEFLESLESLVSLELLGFGGLPRTWNDKTARRLCKDYGIAGRSGIRIKKLQVGDEYLNELNKLNTLN